LKPVLEDIFKINNNLNVYIRGDKDVEYDNVLKLLAVIQNLDPISINLISDPINND
jgi:biopolymer transport protein ExbD